MTDMIAQTLGAAQPLVPIERPKVDPDQATDFNQSRDNIREMIEQAMAALPDMFNLLGQSQDAKMYMAAATFLKTVQDLNVDLVKIHKDKSTVPTAPAQGPTTIQETTNNVVFVGSTEEYMKMKKSRANPAIDVEVIEVDIVPMIEDQ